MATQIQLRGDTLTNWTSNNPIIAEREFVIETDTNKYKIGNGILHYLDLAYKGLDGTNGTNGATGAKGDTGAQGPQGETGAAGTQTVLANTSAYNIGSILSSYDLSTGGSNIILGNQAGNTATNSWTNIFLGNSCGYGSNQLANEVYLGNAIGYTGHDNANNVMMGNSVAYGAHHLQNCVFIGNSVGNSANTASDIVAIGSNAASNITKTGAVLIGYGTTASSNYGIAIGYSAQTSYTGGIAIGRSANTFKDYQCCIGGWSTTGKINSVRIQGVSVDEVFELNLVGGAPASATATGMKGEMRITTDYIYYCTATNVWKRTALTTW